MKKQIMSLGKILSKSEQKNIHGKDEGVPGGGECLVKCNSGSIYYIPNCDGAPDGACHSTGWIACIC